MAGEITANTGYVDYGGYRKSRLWNDLGDCVDTKGDDKAPTQRLPAQLGCVINKFEYGQQE